MASMNMSILASGASSAATRLTGIAVIHQAGSIAMDTATANASGVAIRQTAVIAVTLRTASTNCKSTQKMTKHYEKTIDILRDGGCCGHN